MGVLGTTKALVRAKKNELNPHWESTDADVDACPGLTAPERAAWKRSLASWREFYRADDDWLFGFGTGPIYDQALAYQAALAGWQEKIRVTCALSTPGVPRPPEEAGSADLVSAIKFAAVAVVVAASVYGITRVV
jgi:hypothetical protein